MRDTRPLLLDTQFPPLLRGDIETLQVNLGYRCNLSCTHCHVNAGPSRTEQMSEALIELVLEVLDARRIPHLDLTGGAPEMHPSFEALVAKVRDQGVRITDRCNLTILVEPGFEGLAGLLAEQQVEVIASLPCYSESNVRQQRGAGVFERSIEGLQKLNALGYGIKNELPLHLVYNPNGAFLPPPQQQLEVEYKARLEADYGISFNQLLTIANMPIQRFGAQLLARDQYQTYMTLLKDNYQSANLDSVMCKSQISVDWQGYLYDCDFNQMLNLPLCGDCADTPLIGSDRPRRHLRELINSDFTGQLISVGEHCYACVAGQGSSCGGALGE